MPRIVAPTNITVSTRPNTGGSPAEIREADSSRRHLRLPLFAREMSTMYHFQMRFDKRRFYRKMKNAWRAKKTLRRANLYWVVFGSSWEPRALFHWLCTLITLVGIFRICLAPTKKLSVAFDMGRLRSYSSVSNGMVRGWTQQV